MKEDLPTSPARLLEFENKIRAEFWRDFNAFSPVQTCETREEWMRRVQGPPTVPVFGVDVSAKTTPLERALGHRLGPGGHCWKKAPPADGATAHAASTRRTIVESSDGIRFNIEAVHPLQSAVLDIFRSTDPNP